MLDLHAHILPGVDDGARTQDEALKMLDAASSIGVDTIVATPHVRSESANYPKIFAAYEWLSSRASVAGVRLLLGYEVYYRVLLHKDPARLRHLCITNTNTLLLELSNDHLFPQWEYILSDLVQEGYDPVIAHPERYVYIQEHPEIIAQMRRYGCKIQLDARAFQKPFFSRERIAAEKLLRFGWADYIASDAHHPDDYKYLQKIHRRLKENWPGGVPADLSLHV